MHTKLARKLIWGSVGLASLVVVLTSVALSIGIYGLTERGFKALLAGGAQGVIMDYLRVEDGVIYAQERPDGQTLGVMLRNRDLSATLVDAQGVVLARYGVDKDLPEILPPVKRVKSGMYEDIRVEGYGIFDTYTVPIKAGQEVYGYLRIMRKNTELVILRNAVLGVSVILLPVVWLLAVSVAWQMGKRLTAPLQMLVTHLETVMPEDEIQEIKGSPQMDHEVWVVSQALNKLMTRLRESLKRQKQITENISHEFKTPLTRIAGNLQVGKVVEAEREVLELGGNVDALLSLSIWEKTKEQTDILPIIKEQLKLVPKTLKVECKLPKKLIVPLPYSQVQIMMRNLMDNAIKHNKKEGYIRIEAHREDEEWIMEIRNSTRHKQVAAQKVTQRKYRFGQGAGYGIGMSIVSEMCKLHGLRLEVRDLDGEVRVSVSG